MGIFIVSDQHDAGPSSRLDQLILDHQEHGFSLVEDRSYQGQRICLFNPLDQRDSQYIVLEGGDFIFAAGTFLFDGNEGRVALTAFFRNFVPGEHCLRGTSGHFALLVGKGGRLYCLSDQLGSMKIYHDANRRYHSTSFLALGQMTGTLTPDDYGCYQYVWNETVFGCRTPAREVKSLPVDRIHEIGGVLADYPIRLPVSLEGNGYDGLSLDAIAEAQNERLIPYWKQMLDLFPEKFQCALSGGYDSRLQVALFKQVGKLPHLYTYGRDNDDDVKVARAICEGEGWPIKVINKAARQLDPDEYAETFQKAFFTFDGWRADGLFGPAPDLQDRKDRIAGGKVLLNGSLGEIYRNFWYLPNRSIKARSFVQASYSRYDARACTGAFAPGEFEDILIEEMKSVLGTGSDRFSRAEIEGLYPLFRGRYWTSRDVALNQRFGYAIYPFLEVDTIADTATIPLRHKQFGLLEARMIALLDRQLASYGSSYGYNFLNGPPRGYRIKHLESVHRPIFLRKRAYRIKSRLQQEKYYSLGADYISRLIDPGFPVMGRLFRAEGINDPEAYNRMATLEYLFQRMG
ncbi:hypothetical protein [Aestuariispira insulae]|uniref:Asparagine synthase (Glutamine-hydrolysing) n=1 Tax=Aestuariispira insulae TaxID=1461337 RepID=A0A3D9HK58_9PROT|nr:hypothetical protein [Aestuariispira insulae]RED49880.1 asparagine synthase (glutamine-hydrolysing) [Aestuariispira insulae]